MNNCTPHTPTGHVAAQMLTVYVAHRPAGYTTDTVKGRRAFSLSSAREAALRLAEKLFPEAVQGLVEVFEGNVYTSRWQVVLKPERAQAALAAHGWRA